MPRPRVAPSQAGDPAAAATSAAEREPERVSSTASALWRFVPAAVALVVAIAWIWLLVRTGSPAGDVLRWVGAVVVGVLAPGFAVVRMSRRATAPLIEDLTWAAPAGCLVALFGWFLDRVLPYAPAPYVVGPAVVIAALCVPAARRRVLARPAPGWGPGPALVLGGVMLVALGWMAETGLRAYHLDPGARGMDYYPDVLYQLDLLGEVRHHLVPTYPPVAGTPLAYHWFLYAVDAHLVQHTGVVPFDSTLRLAPATLVPAILMLAAVVARRLCGRVWAGPAAAVLLGVIEISEATRWTTEDGSTGILPRIWRASPPQTMGWFASLALAGTLFAYLRRKPGDRAVPVALLVPFWILTAGSKSSEIPVLLAGLALAGLVQLLRRDWAALRRCAVGLALGLVVFGAASVTIYGSSSYGVRYTPFGVIRARMFLMFPRSGISATASYLQRPHYASVAIVTVTVLWLLPLLPRLLGLLFQLRYRSDDSAGWVCAGTAVGGVLLSLVTRHPAGSEIYFMYSAYPVAVTGAASGLVLAADRVRDGLATRSRRRSFALWLAGLMLVGALASAAVAYAQPHSDPLQRFTSAMSIRHLALLWLTPTVTLLVVLAIVTAVAAVVVRLVWWRNHDADVQSGLRRPPLVWLGAMCLLLGTGLFTMSLEFHGTVSPVGGSVAAVRPPGPVAPGLLPTHRDAIAAGRWVDRHAGADDVVATNLYCRFSRAFRKAHHLPCDTRNFVASAFTQRRTLVGGWGYADRVVSSAWTADRAYRSIPFWNQTLLAQERAAIAHPTIALLDELYRTHHVRWLFVDLRQPPVASVQLDRLARLRFRGPTTAVWQLLAPR